MKKYMLILALLASNICLGSQKQNEQKYFYQSLGMNEYLDQFRPLVYEGHVDQEQIGYFYTLLLEHPEIKTITEIGFNAGHSSEAFLLVREDTTVVSFDLGHYPVVSLAKEYIDDNHSGRHTLILGDSGQTVREFHRAHPNRKFDLIFIDGGHTFEIAMKDIENMRLLAHENTIVVMDDLVPEYPFGVGPNKAWETAKKRGIIKEDQRIKAKGSHKRWAQGRYIFQK